MVRTSLQVKVAQRIAISSDLIQLQLITPEPTQALPSWEPGAHIDVHISPALQRSYSLCNTLEQTTGYWIAIKLEPNSRGGSQFMHALRVGDLLTISEPSNQFELVKTAPAYVLLAGGIGITPLYAMFSYLKAQNRPVDLHYFVRDVQQAAFSSELQALGATIYSGLDAVFTYSKLTDIITRLPPAAALYSCGPAAFLDYVSIIARSQSIPESLQHQERFMPAAALLHKKSQATGFEVHFARSHKTCFVGARQSIIEAAAEVDVVIPKNCEMGICGTCVTAVLEGEPEHYDEVLSPEERTSQAWIVPCISRCSSKRLVLDR